ncbi:hypothetical protein [Prosthecobacter vanneervenii]|uniref:Uncharacterized protein n=1 Tax=Prosthecobacter vanneervenii TaxID=48466 RepID=A0A7W8DIY4_9BACT|nr:hypothetical protein [Prosthecobacter vanneervenii]MBB5031594.1 hypothetical protein [Prosthecobacter vanneervenii]
MSSGLLLVLAASIMWILFCMRFWYIIDRDHVWQRHLIAIAAGLGGGLIYFVGTMLVQALKEPAPQQPAPIEVKDGSDIRVSPRIKESVGKK